MMIIVSETDSADVINQIAGIASDSALGELRQRRVEAARFAQGSYDVLLQPAESGGLSEAERALVALRVAWLTGVHSATAHYRQRLTELDVAAALIHVVERFPQESSLSPRIAAILRYVDLLTQAPRAATPTQLVELQQHDLAVRDIVALAQLIAFVNFQVRVVAALQQMSADPANVIDSVDDASPPPLSSAPDLGTSQPSGFTMAAVDWRAWLPTLDLAEATPEQIAVLEESTPTAKTSQYYLLLVHDVAALRERSRLFNAVMYAPRGLARSDRELATVAVSRINGCVYCAAIHAQRFVQLTKQSEVMQRILDEGVGTPLDERPRALVDYAVKLTRTAAQITRSDIERLRQIGLNDLEILDLTHASAMFAWANRLLQTLGEVIVV